MAAKTRTRWGVGQTNAGWAFNPYTPPPIPTGSYDPALDAQREAANRGLGDLQQDVTTGNTRDTVDYGLGVDSVNRNADRGLADLTTSRDQQAADLGTQRTQVQEDFDRNVAMLKQGYQRLGSRQQQQAAGAGVLDGGALLQAATKRTANQAQDQSQLDAARNRSLGAIDTAQQRLAQGFDLQSGRLGEDKDLSLGQLALQGAPPDASNPLGGRSFQDRLTQTTRAGRENSFFGLDVDASKAFQAAQAGYTPPQPGQPGGAPKNEGADAAGNAYRVVNVGGWQYRVDRQGKIIGRKRVS